MSEAAKAAHQRESPFEKATADISESKLKVYMTDIRPVENQYMARVGEMNDPAQADLAAGMAESGVARKFDPVVRKEARDMALSGAAPNSGAFMARQTALRASGAEALSTAGIGARMGQKQRYMSGLQTIVGMGNNQASEAQATMADLAGQEAERASMDLRVRANDRAALGSAVGMAAGAGVRGALQAWGN
jgi:hypothetical protein